MKQKAEKHLKIALGGNMNISTLTPLALIEIMTDFAKKEVEAINYTRCCEEDNCEHEWTRLDRGRISCDKCEMIQSRM